MPPVKKTPTKISQERLVQSFRDIKNQGQKNNRYCFLIGAGASITSNVKGAGELAGRWFKELSQWMNEEELENWIKKEEIDKNDLASSYTTIYHKRFHGDVKSGYYAIKSAMEKAVPNLGYVILAHILANEPHNYVITTNFDFLIEDAIRLYTDKKPFVVGHEKLANFVTSSDFDRPVIMKVHRDLLLEPFNDNENTDSLKSEWVPALTPVLTDCKLLVVGYGGNDNSLMSYLSDIDENLREPIYWCVRNGKKPNEKIKQLLKAKDFIVEINDFDCLMYSLHEMYNYGLFNNFDKPLEHEFIRKQVKRIEELNAMRKRIAEIYAKKENKDDKAIISVLTGLYDYYYKAEKEKDPEMKKAIYLDGLEKYPESAFLNGMYALFLHELKDKEAEKYYKKALEIDSEEVINLGNYALFLHDIKQEYDNAESYYKKALEIDPEHANILGNYARFLSDIRQKYDKAESYYKKALEIEPQNTPHLGNYALFLHEIRQEYDNAEHFYKKALEIEPEDADNLGNYARFLSDIRQDYDNAEHFYKKALEIDPKHAGYLGNYALFLTDIRKDYDSAESYYKKALEIEPEHANNLGNYAHFLIIARKDYKQAKEYIDKAFAQSNLPDSLLAELWFYRYAHYEEYRQEAKENLEELINQGARSPGWNLQAHVDIAKENGHPEADKLQEFADIISAVEDKL